MTAPSVATPTAEQVRDFKGRLRAFAGDRCEAIWMEITDWRLDADGRCRCAEGSSPPCIQCEGRGVFESDPQELLAFRPAAGEDAGVWVIPCDVCMGYGRDVGKPAIALKFHRLRGRAGECNTDDVIMLCEWCDQAMAANRELARRVVKVTEKTKPKRRTKA